jgi:serine/threonine protein kinase/tetratricopeptide (TPR) repeat protein
MLEPRLPLKTILQEALAMSDLGKRREYLAKACAGDSALRDKIEDLLSLQDPTETRLEQAAPASSPDQMEETGTEIGRYKLLQKIGEGGCGVVYMAEQSEPVRRRVALKVIKLGMDTKSVIARFEAERQALAMMDHPNIARVLDAGATEKGRPYFVMELVRGIKITEYCDQNKLSTDQRLQLFIQVCHAIQHAHQKGIIHRDIKPSNVLVTLHDGVPVPKVIDFGIAKATQGRLTDQTLFTAFEQFIGTPAYMSPEQAEMSGLDVDTRSDIYALGVLLYELLTGETPFSTKELLAASLDEMRHTIREKEPARPSTRISTMMEGNLATIAKYRHTEPGKLANSLRGDLDWIVMKALEKDRTRRYETPSALALDVQRYLNHETVMARPPSATYRFQKFVRKHKAVVAGLGAVGMALVVGLIFSIHFLRLERAAHRRAISAEQKEAELRKKAEQALGLEGELRKKAEENLRLQATLLENARLGEKFGQAGLFMTQGNYDEAERIMNSLDPRANAAPLYNGLGGLNARRGRWAAAITNFSRVVQVRPEEHMFYHYLAPLYVQNGDLAKYEGLRQKILDKFGETTDFVTAERMAKDCAMLPAAEKDFSRIARLAELAVSAPKNHPAYPYFQLAKGLADYRVGKYQEALGILKVVTEKSGDLYRTTQAYAVMAMAYLKAGDRDSARAALKETSSRIEERFPKAGKGVLPDEWNDWIIAHQLANEASALLSEKPG